MQAVIYFLSNAIIILFMWILMLRIIFKLLVKRKLK